MSRTLICLTIAGVFAFVASAAMAETKLRGTYTMGQIWQTCLTTEGGKATNGSGPGGFGCKTDKGEVSCKKTGTLNGGSVGTCTACNPSCSMDAGGGTTGRSTLDDVLSPPTKVQPLENAAGQGPSLTQRATASPGQPAAAFAAGN